MKGKYQCVRHRFYLSKEIACPIDIYMKNKVKLVKFIVNVPEYWIETVDDYHEFESVKYDYKKFGIKVKYEEVGCFKGRYMAVFWIGKKPLDFIKENSIKYSIKYSIWGQ